MNGSADVGPAWPTALQISIVLPPPLDELIEAEFNVAQLRDLARWMDVKLSGTSKAGYVRQIVTVIHERIAQSEKNGDLVLQGLNEEQQDFMRRVFTARDLQTLLPRKLLFAVWARRFERDGDRRLGEMLNGLRRRALIFPTSPMQYGLRDVFYRWLPFHPSAPVHSFEVELVRTPPPEPNAPVHFVNDFEEFLAVAMRSGVEVRPPLPAHPLAERTQWLRGWEHDVEDAQRVMNSRPGWTPDQQAGVVVPLAGPLTTASAATLEDQTGLPASRVELHTAVACAMQLLHAPPADATGPTCVRVNARRVEEWMVLRPEAKLRLAWLYFTQRVADPIDVRAAASVGDFLVQRAVGSREMTPGHVAAEWCALRRYMVRVLRGLPAGQWISWNDLRTQLFEFLPECAWTWTTLTDWWFADGGTRTRLQPTRRDDWMRSLGAVLASIVGDAFAGFGVVDVHKVDGQLRALRITEIGAWLLCETVCAPPQSLAGLRNEAAPIAWNKDAMTLYVQPAPERAEFIVLMRRIADRTAASFTYAVTPASIERALADGLTLDEVTRQFKRSGVPLPKNVAEQFRTASRRFGRVRVYQSLTVLELADELAARELEANTSLMRHVLYRISPRIFVLPEEVVDDLIEEIQAKGYTPRIL